MRIAGTGLVVKTGPADDHAADDDDHAAGVRGGELDEECAAEEAEAEPPAPTGFCFLVAVVTVVLLVVAPLAALVRRCGGCGGEGAAGAAGAKAPSSSSHHCTHSCGPSPSKFSSMSAPRTHDDRSASGALAAADDAEDEREEEEEEEEEPRRLLPSSPAGLSALTSRARWNLPSIQNTSTSALLLRAAPLFLPLFLLLLLMMMLLLLPRSLPEQRLATEGEKWDAMAAAQSVSRRDKESDEEYDFFF